MWCPNCGNEVLDVSSFCMHCGTDLRPFRAAMAGMSSGNAAPAQPTPAPATPAPTPAPAPAQPVQPTPAAQQPINVTPVPVPEQPTWSQPRHVAPALDPQANPTVDRPDDTTAMRHARMFMRMIDAEHPGISYTYAHKEQGDNLNGVVTITMGGGDLAFPPTKFHVDFDYNNSGEGDSVHISMFGLVNYPDDHRAAALEAINNVGLTRRFARVYLDQDNDLCCDADCWVNDNNCAERAWNLLMTMGGVINSEYNNFQHARWS